MQELIETNHKINDHRGIEIMKFNLNKLLPFLNIRKKLIIAFSLLSFVPLILIGSIGLYVNITSMYDNALNNLAYDVSMLKE